MWLRPVWATGGSLRKQTKKKTMITKGLMEALVSVYTTNPLLIKRKLVNRSFQFSTEFKMMVWTMILLVLFKIKLNWIKKHFLKLSVVA